MDRYNFKKTEEKWQKFWEKNKTFKSKTDLSKKKFYCLEMFPYPSGKNTHGTCEKLYDWRCISTL